MRHGGGGFTYWECYQMPIKIRKWNVKRLSKEIKEENEQRTAANKKTSSTGTSFSMEDMISGKGIEQMKTDYKAPPKKNPNQQPLKTNQSPTPKK